MRGEAMFVAGRIIRSAGVLAGWLCGVPAAEPASANSLTSTAAARTPPSQPAGRQRSGRRSPAFVIIAMLVATCAFAQTPSIDSVGCRWLCPNLLVATVH